MENPPDDSHADRLLAGLREFVAGLDAHERELLAVLLAPGVARADSPALPRELTLALARARVRVIGLGLDDPEQPNPGDV